MALQVWLPLNGDLHNQGLNSNILFTGTNNITIDNNGKIGKCYSFNGEDNCYLSSSVSVDLEKTMNVLSLTGWIKINDLTKNQMFFGLSGSSSGSSVIRLYYNQAESSEELIIWVASSSKRFILNDGSNNTNNFIMDTDWHHYAVVFNINKVFLYIDGKPIKENGVNVSGSLNTTNTRKIFVGGSFSSGNDYGYQKAYGLNGLVNDIRFYDHALSPKEVEEIAKGLILWYQLNGENQILVPSGYQQLEYLESTGTQSINTGIIPTDTHKFNFKYALMEFNSYKGPFGSYGSGESDKCTRIICANGSSTNVLVYFTSQPSGGTSGSSANVNITTAAGQIVEGYLAKTGYLLHNLTTDVTQSSNTAFADSGAANNATMRLFGINASYSKTRIYYFDTYNNGSCVQKLIPAKRLSDNVLGMYDVITKTFFTNIGTGTFTAGPNTSITGTVYDSSGYSNNGTIIGSLTAATGSPRYNTATVFDGSTSQITTTSVSSEVKTISAWVNFTTLESDQYAIIMLDYKSKLALCLDVYGIVCSTTGAGNSYRYSKASLTTNTWYHFVVINPEGNTSTTRQLYINGAPQTALTTKNSFSFSTDQLQIGKRASGSSSAYPFSGKIADVRLYATALTADQVKELYNTSMSVDSNGNVHARELVELL